MDELDKLISDAEKCIDTQPVDIQKDLTGLREYAFDLADRTSIAEEKYRHYRVIIPDATEQELYDIIRSLKDCETVNNPKEQYLRHVWTHENPMSFFSPTSMKTFVSELFKYA